MHGADRIQDLFLSLRSRREQDPRVERGFASETTGKVVKKIQPAKRASEAFESHEICRPLHGLTIFMRAQSWGSALKASLHPRLYTVDCFAG
jgi:hypothetical protein